MEKVLNTLSTMEDQILKHMEERMVAMFNQSQNSHGDNQAGKESSSRNKSKGFNEWTK
jgi:hypothetical protein